MPEWVGCLDSDNVYVRDSAIKEMRVVGKLSELGMPRVSHGARTHAVRTRTLVSGSLSEAGAPSLDPAHCTLSGTLTYLHIRRCAAVDPVPRELFRSMAPAERRRMCMDICTDMYAVMYVIICTGMCAGMRTHTWMGMLLDIYIDMSADMCAVTCTDTRTDTCWAHFGARVIELSSMVWTST